MGAPIVGIHRADLLAALARHVPPADIRLEARFVDFVQDDHGVTAHFADGRQERGELLIGADGIHSRVRELVVADSRRYCGYVGWRGVADLSVPDLPTGLSIWTYGRGSQFGIIPIGGRRVFWFGTATMPEERIPHLGPHRQELAQRFHDWHDPIPAIAEAADVDTLIRTPIYDRPPVERWGTAPITLLGDAAHATTPTLGQGACLAIESALVLAGCLCRSPAVEPALRRYERDRQARTARIIRQSWHLGRRIQWRNPLACWFRDQVVRWMPLRWHLRALEQIVAPGCVDGQWTGPTGPGGDPFSSGVAHAHVPDTPSA
jgi:2-polyprenyl-6-methoxyphenol hydroxylase-like FAD-dependent oxidoreductase